jgi:isoquinoline 1-oxidoreductase alpha subunit
MAATVPHRRPPLAIMAPIEFELNGAPVRVVAPDGTPLLWVLRDVLNLTGTKYGCGLGLCGACTVHVDGVATRTCSLPFENVAARRVVTIEGLAATSDDGRHPVQRAWLAEAVPQCGFCQSGQIMTAAALLATTPRPDDAQIDAAMNGVLCRCGTYQRIRAAIHRAAGAGR